MNSPTLPQFPDPGHTPKVFRVFSLSIARSFLMSPGKPKQGSLVANSRKERIRANRVTFRTIALFGKPPELLHNIYYPSARSAARRGLRPSAPGTGLREPAQSALPAPTRPGHRRPPPGIEPPESVQTKAERSPCCNSRGPGREKVPDRERREQQRAGLEVDKILRPFHSHIKQLFFFSFLKKKKSAQQKTSLDGTERGVWAQE